MVIRMRHTRSHTKNRRSHHALKATNLSTDSAGKKHLRHRMTDDTGTYRGRQVVDMVAKVQKKQGKVVKMNTNTSEKETKQAA